MNELEIIQLIRDGGLVVVLLLTLIGGAKRLWVFGWTYKDLERDRDEWKALALDGTHLAVIATDHVVEAEERRLGRARTRRTDE